MNILRASPGFSLVELVVTMAVLGILVAAAAPNLQAFLDKNRVVGAAEAVYGQLQFARSEAVKQSADMVAVFQTTAPWCVGYSRDTTCDCTRAVDDPGACTILGDGVTAVLKVIDGSTFSGVTMTSPAPAPITFNGVRGTAGGGGAVLLQSSLGRQMQVEVNVLGRVRLCSPSGSGAIAGYPTC